MNEVKVSVCYFDDIFDIQAPTCIPDYQRSYVWGKKKAEELLTDFIELFVENNSQENYYLGSILIYNNKDVKNEENKCEIIDGQQRITTLLILRYILDGSLPENQKIQFNTSQSVHYIKEVRDFFEEHRKELEELHEKNFLQKLEFTKIITYSEDDAFTFFDTQNNRGIKLSATDFLKAYHLREIRSEQLQEKNALLWENIGYKNPQNSFLDYFFERMLWRGRNWRGKSIAYESKDTILECFQKNTLKTDHESSYPLYQSPNNIRYQKINWTGDDLPEFSSTTTYSNSPLYFPFSLRQPIHKGMNFFDYTKKYVSIYELLFESEVAEADPVNAMRIYFTKVYDNDMSPYLKDLMKLLLIVFYDAFGKEKICKAINYFDYSLGSLRLKNQQVKKESILKFLREQSINLIDLISMSYFPEDIFENINNSGDLLNPYLNKEIESDNGVRGRYLQRVLQHFQKDYIEISNRKLWLEQIL